MERSHRRLWLLNKRDPLCLCYLAHNLISVALQPINYIQLVGGKSDAVHNVSLWQTVAGDFIYSLNIVYEKLIVNKMILQSNYTFL